MGPPGIQLAEKSVLKHADTWRNRKNKIICFHQGFAGFGVPSTDSHSICPIELVLPCLQQCYGPSLFYRGHEGVTEDRLKRVIRRPGPVFRAGQVASELENSY